MKKIHYLLLFLFSCLYSTAIMGQTEQTYQLSTHILDINRGIPAEGVTITLFKLTGENQSFEKIDSGVTDTNGRIANFLPSGQQNEGIYKLKFETASYFTGQHLASIYPYIEVIFEIKDSGHYHIPITVTANGYSTYRGS